MTEKYEQYYPTYMKICVALYQNVNCLCISGIEKNSFFVSHILLLIFCFPYFPYFLPNYKNKLIEIMTQQKLH